LEELRGSISCLRCAEAGRKGVHVQKTRGDKGWGGGGDVPGREKLVEGNRGKNKEQEER